MRLGALQKARKTPKATFSACGERVGQPAVRQLGELVLLLAARFWLMAFDCGPTDRHYWPQKPKGVMEVRAAVASAIAKEDGQDGTSPPRPSVNIPYNRGHVAP
jgi:hypothetical protein